VQAPQQVALSVVLLTGNKPQAVFVPNARVVDAALGGPICANAGGSAH